MLGLIYHVRLLFSNSLFTHKIYNAKKVCRINSDFLQEGLPSFELKISKFCYLNFLWLDCLLLWICDGLVLLWLQRISCLFYFFFNFFCSFLTICLCNVSPSPLGVVMGRVGKALKDPCPYPHLKKDLYPNPYLHGSNYYTHWVPIHLNPNLLFIF